jgi:hypothetical protein
MSNECIMLIKEARTPIGAVLKVDYEPSLAGRV